MKIPRSLTFAISFLLLPFFLQASMVWTPVQSVAGGGGDDDSNYGRWFGWVGAFNIKTDSNRNAIYTTSSGEQGYIIIKLISSSEFASNATIFSGYAAHTGGSYSISGGSGGSGSLLIDFNGNTKGNASGSISGNNINGSVVPYKTSWTYNGSVKTGGTWYSFSGNGSGMSLGYRTGMSLSISMGGTVVNGTFQAQQSPSGIYYHGPFVTGTVYGSNSYYYGAGNGSGYFVTFDVGTGQVVFYSGATEIIRFTPPSDWSGYVAILQEAGQKEGNTSDGWNYAAWIGSYVDPTPVPPNGSLTAAPVSTKQSTTGKATLTWKVW